MSDPGATTWPSIDRTEKPSEGWAIRSEMDPLGSRFGWFHAALAADELELAGRIMSTPVASAEHEGPRRAALAEALVLVGRAAEARMLLEADGVTSPQPGGPADWRQALLGATYAAGGDHAAWSWLTARLSNVTSEWRLQLTRVVAAVADQRGDLAVADEAWADVSELSGVSSPRLAQRTALARLLRRNREASADSTIEIVFHAYRTLRGAAVDDKSTRDAVIAAASALDERGDGAGARLVLRSAAGMLPRDGAIGTALRRLHPAPSRARVLAHAGSGLAIVAALAFLVARWVASPQTLGADIRLTGLGVAMVFGLVAQLSPIPGFTMPETRAWRGLSSLRYDPFEARGGTSDRSGWFGLAGILGAVVTFTTVAVVLSTLTPDGTWPSWALTSSAFLLFLVLTAAGGAGGVLVMRHVRRRIGRRRVARARAEGEALADQHAAVCECWDVFSTWGPDARRYAERHLTVAGPPDSVAVPDSYLRTCPTTGLPWLVGPIGQTGRFLALKGALRDVDKSAAGRSKAPTGLYL